METPKKTPKISALQQDPDHGLLRRHLHFGEGNSKLGEETLTFTLPAGYTCPGAHDCLAWFDRDTRKLMDGEHAQFRCFAATSEMRTSVSKSVERNLQLLIDAKTIDGMAELIKWSLPRGERFKYVRIHVGGDFFSRTYFAAWAEVARQVPNMLFYAYTKSLPIWIGLRKLVPKNLIITASEGGKFDHLISHHELRYAKVVYSLEEAAILGLEIDHDDSHARNPDVQRFGLLIHGGQQSGSAAAIAKAKLVKANIKHSYVSKRRTKTKTNH